MAAEAPPNVNDVVSELDDEDEEADGANEGSKVFPRDSHTAKVQGWFKVLCHWHRAFLDLDDGGSLARVLALRKFSIIIIEATPVTLPKQQASLSETLTALQPNDPEYVRRARNLLRNQAPKPTKPKPNDTEDPNVHVGTVLTGKDDGQWVNAFWGRVHCEAHLACAQVSVIDVLDAHQFGPRADPSLDRDSLRRSASRSDAASVVRFFSMRSIPASITPGRMAKYMHGRLLLTLLGQPQRKCLKRCRASSERTSKRTGRAGTAVQDPTILRLIRRSL